MADLTRAVVYSDDVSGLRPEDVRGFFERWPRVPSLPRIFAGADHAVLARGGAAGRVVGFVYYERFGMRRVSRMVIRNPEAL